MKTKSTYVYIFTNEGRYGEEEYQRRFDSHTEAEEFMNINEVKGVFHKVIVSSLR
jgi:hypothetical protein